MNIFSKLFGNKSCKKTIIEKTVENNNKVTINEAEEKMEENSFRKQKELADLLISFFSDEEKGSVFESCFEASAFAEVVIYLQEKQERRVSLADVICFFQRPIYDICADISYIVSEGGEKLEIAQDLLTLLSYEEDFNTFKTATFNHFSKFTFIFPDLKTFKITGAMDYMIENDVFNIAHCETAMLQDYIDNNY